MNNTIVITEYDRVMAFLLYKGTMYESDCNHQECLCEILEFEGTSYEERYGFSLYEEDVDNTDKAAEITYEMIQGDEYDVIGFDLWEVEDELIFTCHFKKYADKYMAYIKDFAKSRGYIFAYYINSDTICIVN